MRALLLLPALAAATPNIYLPVNAQVPPVARIGQNYDFTFSEATTASTSGPISYTLANSPAWLSLQDRTFSGTPQPSDDGAFVVDLEAHDATGTLSMSVTLVVSDDSGPKVGMSIADQLPAYGSFQSPNALLVAPSSSISLSFSPDTFTNTSLRTNYYALSANNTPLPSWIRFDPQALSFVGAAPQGISPADTSETFQIELAASDVVGFAQAIVTFQIIVETHLLEFRSSLQILNVSAGSPLSSSVLKDSLQLDAQPVNASVISHVTASPPSWLKLDSGLMLLGTPPGDVVAQNFTVSVTDTLNNSASTMIILQVANGSASSLLSPIGAVNATIGQPFDYFLNDTLAKDMLSVSVDLGTASSWLTFDQKQQQLHGQVPADLKPQQVVVNITASQGSDTQSELLTIAVQKQGQSPHHEEASAAVASSSSRDHRWIAAAVVLPICLIVSALILLFCCCRKRRQKATRSEHSGSTSSFTGKLPPVEKATDTGMSGGLVQAGSRVSLPPKLPWTWLSARPPEERRKSRSSFTEKPHRPDSWSRFAANFIQPRPSNFSNIPEEPTVTSPNKEQVESAEVKDRASAPVSLGSSGLLYKNIMSGRAPGRGHGSVMLSFTDEKPRPARIQRSWRNAGGSQSTSDWTDTTDSQSEARVKTRGPTIRAVWPSQTYSRRSSTPGLAVPKSVRVRQSENPFLSGGSIYPRDFSSGSAVTRGRRRSSQFDYSIAPRVVDSRPLSDDGRYESAVPSESQSMYEYCTSEEDVDSGRGTQEEDFWQDEVEEPTSSAAWLSKEGRLQRLLKMPEEEEEDLRLRSPRARKMDDLQHAATYTSVRGDIKESGSSVFL